MIGLVYTPFSSNSLPTWLFTYTSPILTGIIAESVAPISKPMSSNPFL